MKMNTKTARSARAEAADAAARAAADSARAEALGITLAGYRDGAAFLREIDDSIRTAAAARERYAAAAARLAGYVAEYRLDWAETALKDLGAAEGDLRTALSLWDVIADIAQTHGFSPFNPDWRRRVERERLRRVSSAVGGFGRINFGEAGRRFIGDAVAEMCRPSRA